MITHDDPAIAPSGLRGDPGFSAAAAPDRGLQTSRLDEAGASGDLAADDRDLARRAALGDRPAFAALVERHGAPLFRYAVTMLDGDTHDAQDVVQAAWTKAWVGLPRFRGDSAVRTWLFRIVANEALASRRRRRPIPIDDRLLEPVPGPETTDPAHHASAEELQRALQAALEELPWRQRACWVLAEQEDMTYTQIAQALDTSETVVRGQLHRARRTLATRLAHWR